MKRYLIGATVLAVSLPLLAACGDSDDTMSMPIPEVQVTDSTSTDPMPDVTAEPTTGPTAEATEPAVPDLTFDEWKASYLDAASPVVEGWETVQSTSTVTYKGDVDSTLSSSFTVGADGSSYGTLEATEGGVTTVTNVSCSATNCLKSVDGGEWVADPEVRPIAPDEMAANFADEFSTLGMPEGVPNVYTVDGSVFGTVADGGKDDSGNAVLATRTISVSDAGIESAITTNLGSTTLEVLNTLTPTEWNLPDGYPTP